MSSPALTFVKTYGLVPSLLASIILSIYGVSKYTGYTGKNIYLILILYGFISIISKVIYMVLLKNQPELIQDKNPAIFWSAYSTLCLVIPIAMFTLMKSPPLLQFIPLTLEIAGNIFLYLPM